MSRLVTIGCSLTEYCYPTWADMAGTHFDEHYNLGNPGCGHTYMLNIFTEANLILNLGKGDTVIVMSSSFIRYDVWLPSTPGRPHDWGWQGNGNVWAGGMPDDFLKYCYSDEFNLMNSLACLKSIKDICELKGINFILLKGFPTDFTDYYPKTNVEYYDKELNNLYSIGKVPLYQVLEDKFGEVKGYNWNDTDIPDAHPTVQMHGYFLNTVIPQYGVDQSFINELESNINFQSQELNRDVELFKKVKGKKLGSLITRNFSNYNMKNFKYSG